MHWSDQVFSLYFPACKWIYQDDKVNRFLIVINDCIFAKSRNATCILTYYVQAVTELTHVN